MKLSSKLGIGLIAGVAAGYVASLFVSTKTRQKHKQLIEDKASKLNQLLSDSKEYQKMKDLFGDKYKDVLPIYQEAKVKLVTKVTQLQKQFDKVSLDDYKRISQEVWKQMVEKREIEPSTLESLKKQLNQDWKALTATPAKRGRKAKPKA